MDSGGIRYDELRLRVDSRRERGLRADGTPRGQSLIRGYNVYKTQPITQKRRADIQLFMSVWMEVTRRNPGDTMTLTEDVYVHSASVSQPIPTLQWKL